jgi:type I restriction enzyme R subunit
MHPPHPDSEEALENATIELFSQLHWETANCYDENVRIQVVKKGISEGYAFS